MIRQRPLDLVCREIVHDDNVAGGQAGREPGGDLGQESVAVHRTVQQPRRRREPEPWPKENPFNRISFIAVLISCTAFAITARDGGATSTGANGLIVAAQSDAALSEADIKRGKKLAARKGCAACHSFVGRAKAGPAWQGLFGRTRTLTDGTTVNVNLAYLATAIFDPNAQVAEGFLPGLMPKDFSKKLNETDVDALIAFIKNPK